MTKDEIYSINHSYEIAIRNLNSDAWDKMDITEKVQDLQAIENKNAMEQNRLACEVSAQPMEKGEWGIYQGMQIIVNSNELNNQNIKDNVDTIFHEGSHARDWQAQYFSEIRSQYAPGQLEERNSPIPSPEKDLSGYYNHPAEVAARQAGARGVSQIEWDREQILSVDREMNEAHPVNQILQTYDYIVMDNSLQKEDSQDITIRNQILQIDTSNSAAAIQLNEKTDECDLSFEIAEIMSAGYDGYNRVTEEIDEKIDEGIEVEEEIEIDEGIDIEDGIEMDEEIDMDGGIINE